MKKLLLATTLVTLFLTGKGQDTCDTKVTFYHPKYNGRKTSSGEIYSDKKFTAASNDFPLGTKLLIINKQTGKSVTVVVNDRMAHYIKNHVDLSKIAFKVIAPIASGTCKARVTVL